MTNLMEVGRSSLDTPRSPHSASTDSSRRSSLRAYYPEHDLEPVSTSPRMRLTRKRAASLDVDAANQPRIGDLALDSASTNGPATSSGALTEQVCLCQPDPKIPRPRNAFILYRQHMQSQVVAAHPGLANPEISKIIGEQWKNQTPEVKSTWKQLAEEEKQRHSRQYPGYRYQPRRAGKSSGIHPVSAVAEGGPTRCPKCNGRYISTPSTPLTPFTPGFGLQGGPRTDRAPPPFTPSRMAEPERSRYPPQMQLTRMDSPRMSSRETQNKRGHYGSHYMSPVYERDNDTTSPTPEGKRRRYDGGGRPSISSPTHFSQQQQSFGRPGGDPSLSSSYRQSQPPPLPVPYNAISRGPQNAQMGPPPHHQTSQNPGHPYLTRSSTSTNPNLNPFDESLRLPPLQTQMHNTTPMPSSSTSSSRMHSIDHSTGTSIRESQARSIEAMVMTIPYINKIKILHRISPPLAPPGPTSPAYETRGVVIAVEGFERGLLEEVGAFVEETLRGEAAFAVRCWDTLAENAAHGHGYGHSHGHTHDQAIGNDNNNKKADIEMLDKGNLPSPPPLSAATATATATTSSSASLGKGKGKGKSLVSASISIPATPGIAVMEEDPFVEYLSIISTMHRQSHEIVKHITSFPPSPHPQSQTHPHHQTQKKIPIALLPSGFSLTTSNTFALKIPINDSYAPIDHWQWMATLWRGIVGPDLTVLVTRCGREEGGRFGGVECRGDVGGIVVRVLDSDGDREGFGGGGRDMAREGGYGTGSGGVGMGGGMDEKTRRRLGFEVLEFVRGGGEGGWGRS